MQKNQKAKKTNKKKFKTIYLVPVLFLLIVAIVGLSVFQSLFQDGPVYGDRCAGITEIADSDVTSVEDSIPQEYSSVESLGIEVKCKTVAIDIKFAPGTTAEQVSEVCEAILLGIDANVGLSKSNSESQYSDLFGTYNGKTQYHVDFIMEGSDDIFPIFATKHPSSDKINYTYNTPKNPTLVEELTQDE